MRAPAVTQALVSLAVALVQVPLASAVNLDPDDDASIRDACAVYAHDFMSGYTNNQTTTPPTDVGTLPQPYYWWHAGAAWAGFVEYSFITGDHSYDNTVAEALAANAGPDHNVVLPWRHSEEGNDDQLWWTSSFMSAAEYDFPLAAGAEPYIDVAKAAFDSLRDRWDPQCGGGLLWQMYADSVYGLTYKNAVTNGVFFSLAARLARFTGDGDYAAWAEKVWDWGAGVGLVSPAYQVWDGTHVGDGCSTFDHHEWTYSMGAYLHGAALLYDGTKDAVWRARVEGLLGHAAVFFQNPAGEPNVLHEKECEPDASCNLDQQSFKAYLARFLAKAAVLAPFAADQIGVYLRASAVGAARACSGGASGSQCGLRWYTPFDGSVGFGEQLAALEVTQSVLLLRQKRAPATQAGG